MAYQLKRASGPNTGDKIDLDDELTVGTDPDSQLTVAGEGAGTAARLSVDEQGVLVESLDSDNPVMLNGDPVSSSRVGAGDELRIGRDRFVLQASGMKPVRVLSPRPDIEEKPGFPWGIAAAVVAALAAGGFWAWQAGYLAI